MLPVPDDHSEGYIKPYINYFIIALNVLVFIFFQKFGTDTSYLDGYSTVPAEILTGKDIVTQGQSIIDQYTNQSFYLQGLQSTYIPVWLTLFTSMFMHGSFISLTINMLFLWIFGGIIENRLGHIRYAAFYLTMGVLASLSHVFSTVISAQNSLIPCFGATGAISGILGAYMLLFPQKRVDIFFYITTFAIPAFVALGFWVALQIICGSGIFGNEDNGGVTYAAHAGGFIAGILLIKLFEKRKIEMYIK